MDLQSEETVQRYKLSDTITEIGDKKELSKDELEILILTKEEFKDRSAGMPHHHLLVRYMENPSYCKAEMFGSCVLGTFAIPRQDFLWEKKTVFGYYMAKQELMFVDDGDYVENQIIRMKEIRYGKEAGIPDFFNGFLDYMIHDDSLYLQHYERQIAEMEETLLAGIPKDFYATILKYRKDVMVLHSYYDQLVNMAEILQANTNQMMTQEQCQGFGNFASRCSRLHNQTETLREYILQIREMYQTQLDLVQNKTMNLLTIVTAIFLPLTLMVGWYGMNFANMPELHWKYGYVGMIVASILIVGAEIYYFRKKKLI